MTSKNIFKVEDIFSIMGVGIIVVGKLNSGFLKKGMKTTINGKLSEILKIESQNQSVESLTTGIPAGLCLNNISKDDIQKGNEYLFV